MVNERIDVKNLNLWFGENHILKNISFSIKKQNITAIIGPSGCGKTTLLRCFNRMHDLNEKVNIKGEIILDGENILSKKTDVFQLRMKVGMVFQKPNPFPKSILENILFGLKIKGIKNKEYMMQIVEEALKKAWLWDEVKDRLNKNALELSGGQQQRLCIARALATNPEVILFDEPTSALDPQSTLKIEELLLQLKKYVTVIIVTHNIGQAGRVSDFTAFLYLGELIEYGETKKMFTTPQNKKTEEYLSGRFG
uniref:Phosphate ABC transporter ATP-binding protein n=1 Tax=candidate division WOR-3 bacterium TaxID=2052148 RepID=A0A7C4Y6C3_UNCW3